MMIMGSRCWGEGAGTRELWSDVSGTGDREARKRELLREEGLMNKLGMEGAVTSPSYTWACC